MTHVQQLIETWRTEKRFSEAQGREYDARSDDGPSYWHGKAQAYGNAADDLEALAALSAPSVTQAGFGAAASADLAKVAREIRSGSSASVLPPDQSGPEQEKGPRVDGERLSGQSLTAASQEETYQRRVRAWVLDCFGQAIADDMTERSFRFLEEALELVQAVGCTQEQAARLVAYVYGRPIGERWQEVGGVMVTLAALTSAAGIDMAAEAERELARVCDPAVTAKIRRKQAAKRGVVSHVAEVALPGEWSEPLPPSSPSLRDDRPPVESGVKVERPADWVCLTCKHAHYFDADEAGFDGVDEIPWGKCKTCDCKAPVYKELFPRLIPPSSQGEPTP